MIFVTENCIFKNQKKSTISVKVTLATIRNYTKTIGNYGSELQLLKPSRISHFRGCDPPIYRSELLHFTTLNGVFITQVSIENIFIYLRKLQPLLWQVRQKLQPFSLGCDSIYLRKLQPLLWQVRQKLQPFSPGCDSIYLQKLQH